MTPYYADDAVTIYHGDAREVVPTLTFGAIVADPPYGMSYDPRNSSRGGNDFRPVAGDSEPFGGCPSRGHGSCGTSAMAC